MSDNKSLMRSAEKSLNVKSLKDLVRVRTAENSVLLMDVSGSMNAYMRNGKTRIEGLREVVVGLQTKKTTTMVAFGLKPYDESGLEKRAEVAFVSEVPDAQGGTPLAEAIEFARVNGFGRAVVVSDGEPNDERAAMEAAMQFGGRIDVVFVGDPGGHGSMFLDRMAQATGGTRFEGDLSDVKELTGAIVGLLAGELLEVDDEDDEDDDDGDESEEDDDEDEDEDEDED